MFEPKLKKHQGFCLMQAPDACWRQMRVKHELVLCSQQGSFEPSWRGQSSSSHLLSTSSCIRLDSWHCRVGFALLSSSDLHRQRCGLHDMQLTKQSNMTAKDAFNCPEESILRPYTMHSAAQTQSICSFGQVSVVLDVVIALSCSCLTNAGSPRQSS